VHVVQRKDSFELSDLEHISHCIVAGEINYYWRMNGGGSRVRHRVLMPGPRR